MSYNSCGLTARQTPKAARKGSRSLWGLALPPFLARPTKAFFEIAENVFLRGQRERNTPAVKGVHTYLDLESPNSPLPHRARRPTRRTASTITLGQCFGAEYCFFQHNGEPDRGLLQTLDQELPDGVRLTQIDLSHGRNHPVQTFRIRTNMTLMVQQLGGALEASAKEAKGLRVQIPHVLEEGKS